MSSSVILNAFLYSGGAPAVAPTVAKTGEAQALHDFPGQSDGDLAFQAGDTITLLEIIDEAWMKGELRGQSGIFPANFVTVTKPLE